MIGLLGKKLGMTHVYDAYGRRRAVTAVQAGPCTVICVRKPAPNGSSAVQVGYQPVQESQLTKPEAGQFKKAGVSPFRYVREFRQEPSAPGGKDAEQWKVGQQLTVELFKEYELVDVTGVSIGKGFQGGMKRWHWKGGPRTHGSTSHRRPGSIGSTTTPGRVWKGHHLPGHMGAERVTIQNVRIAQLDAEHHLLFIEGSIPGSERQLVMVRKSVKRPGVIKPPQALRALAEDEEEVTNKNAKAARAAKAKTK